MWSSFQVMWSNPAKQQLQKTWKRFFFPSFISCRAILTEESKFRLLWGQLNIYLHIGEATVSAICALYVDTSNLEPQKKSEKWGPAVPKLGVFFVLFFTLKWGTQNTTVSKILDAGVCLQNVTRNSFHSGEVLWGPGNMGGHSMFFWRWACSLRQVIASPPEILSCVGSLIWWLTSPSSCTGVVYWWRMLIRRPVPEFLFPNSVPGRYKKKNKVLVAVFLADVREIQFLAAAE